MDKPAAAAISHFSDVLRVGAYAAQIKLDELQRAFGDQVRSQGAAGAVSLGDFATRAGHQRGAGQALCLTRRCQPNFIRNAKTVRRT